MASASTNGTNTPNNPNIISSDSHEDEGTVPWPGKSLIIQQCNTRSILAIMTGELKLAKASEMYHGRFRWNCKEKGGHLGFQNCPDGNFIGYDIHSGKFIATSSCHSHAQYLVPRRHPEGGYVLLTDLHGEMVGMMVTDRGILTSRNADAWTRWNFHDISWIY